MDGEPLRRRRLREEARELGAAHAVRADLFDDDAATVEVFRDRVGRVAKTARRDELTFGVRACAGWQTNVEGW